MWRQAANKQLEVLANHPTLPQNSHTPEHSAPVNYNSLLMACRHELKEYLLA